MMALRDTVPTPDESASRARLAMQRGDWPEALSIWNEVLSRFEIGAKPTWETSRARVLVELDLLDQAVPEYERLRRDCRGQPSGFVGLAQVATRRRLWSQALAAWDEVLRRFPGSPDMPVWTAARAGVLMELGRTTEAERALRDLPVPTAPSVLLALLRVLMVTGRPADALLELDSSEHRSLEIPGIIERRFDILLHLQRLQDARQELERLLVRSDSLAVLQTLFNFIPALYEGWERTQIWLALLDRLNALENRSSEQTQTPPYGLTSLRLRLLLALRDYREYVHTLSNIPDPQALGRHRDMLLAVAATLRESPFPDYRKPKVFGIGLSKTGTTTLARALRELGFQVLDWLNPLTREMMSDEDLYLFDAFTDTPVATGFERLYHLFSHSLFVYTERPLDSWKPSILQHWRRHYGVNGFEHARHELSLPDRFHHGRQFRSLRQSLYFNHSSFESAYLAHDRRVRNFFQDKPPGRLLEFDVFSGDGWPQLCAFLGRAIPSTPFPWENRKP
jgi:tetratricopeptide (TPR) repeat protein